MQRLCPKSQSFWQSGPYIFRSGKVVSWPMPRSHVCTGSGPPSSWGVPPQNAHQPSPKKIGPPPTSPEKCTLKRHTLEQCLPSWFCLYWPIGLARPAPGVPRSAHGRLAPQPGASTRTTGFPRKWISPPANQHRKWGGFKRRSS